MRAYLFVEVLQVLRLYLCLNPLGKMRLHTHSNESASQGHLVSPAWEVR